MIFDFGNNIVMATGRVTGRVTFGETSAKRTPYLQFGMKADYNSATGESTYINLKAFGSLAEQFCGIDKGTDLLVAGRRDVREYQGKTYEDIVLDFMTIAVAPYSNEAKAAGIHGSAAPKSTAVSKSLGGGSAMVDQIAAQMIAAAEAEGVETDEELPF